MLLILYIVQATSACACYKVCYIRTQWNKPFLQSNKYIHVLDNFVPLIVFQIPFTIPYIPHKLAKDRHLESESRTKNKSPEQRTRVQMSPEAHNDIKMHFYDFYQINLYVFNKFQIYFINYSGF